MSETNEMITLELGTEEPAVEQSVVATPLAVQKDITEHYLEQVNLSESEQKMVTDFSEKIDLKDSGIILQYGASAQKKIAAFSDSALEGVRTKDLGQIGDMITDLVSELKDFSLEESKGFWGLFKKAGSQISRLKTKYNHAEINVNRITEVLEGHQNQLLTDIVMLDKMYDNNLLYFKELTMYIMAGKRKLELERSTTLADMQQQATASGLTEDAQAANDFAALCDRFEKKLHDLELTRTISIQMAPQIRLIQNSNTLMAEKIQSTINNTIPLWKNQMVLALGMAHSREAMEAQREVSDLTNELLKKNAETLKQGTVDIARESERSIVDIETVRYTNEQLIATLDEVLQIQDEGRQKRLEAESEMVRIETELKQKLLETRK
ncbi:MAG: toxic anion resistance protein [Oscillospiraceae bacterium]|nr:toxic anion resistance protein [Oscillospiraceae bacterium]MBQ4538188.1 toxic anion resistance protein [Oscillospiraceae bacterium]